MASTSSFFFIFDRPVIDSRLATSSKCSLLALASTPPLVFRSVFRPPAAWASEGPFLPFFSQWSPTFSKLCLTAAQATWLARRSSPYSSAAESCALAKVLSALAGDRFSVLGRLFFFPEPLFVVLGIVALLLDRPA